MEEELKKELEQQLLELKLSGIREKTRLDRQFQEEIERIERSHRDEMSRMSVSEMKLRSENEELERKSAEFRREAEREASESERRNAKKENKLRSENRKLFENSVREGSEMESELQSHQNQMTSEAIRAIGRCENERKAQEIGRLILECDEKWTEIKQFYGNELRLGLEEFEDSNRESFLNKMDMFRKKKEELNKRFVEVRRALGALRQAMSTESWDGIQKALKSVTTDGRFEENELVDVRRAIMRKTTFTLEDLENSMETFQKAMVEKGDVLRKTLKMAGMKFDWNKALLAEAERIKDGIQKTSAIRRQKRVEENESELRGNWKKVETETKKMEEKTKELELKMENLEVKTEKSEEKIEKTYHKIEKIEENMEKKDEKPEEMEEKSEKSEELFEKMIEKSESFRDERLVRLLELQEADRKEKEIIATVDSIFDVIRTWDEIEFLFFHLVAFNKTLKTVEVTEESKRQMRESMMKKGMAIGGLHAAIEKTLSEVLGSIDDLMDVVVMGTSSTQRMYIVLALKSMGSCPFWTLTLGNFESLCKATEKIEKNVREVKEVLLKLSLCQLRPRKSVRQMLQDDVVALQRDWNLLFN